MTSQALAAFDSSQPLSLPPFSMTLLQWSTAAAPATPLAITPVVSPPSGMVGAGYSLSLTASGGTEPYAWDLVDGALPAGMTLGSSGLISGTATEAGSFHVTIRLTDAADRTTTIELTLQVAPQPQPGTLHFGAQIYNAVEALTNFTVSVLRTGGSDGVVSVDYATTGGTAVPNVDYIATGGTLTFLDGETTKTFEIALLDDSLFETNKTILLDLGNVTGGATLGSFEGAVLTLGDNEQPPSGKPDLSIRRSNEITWFGNNVYNDTAVGQSRSQTATLGLKRIFHLLLQNEGTVTDTFFLQGDARNSAFLVGYFTGTARGSDITTPVVGGIRTVRLAPRQSAVLRIEITPTKHARRGMTKSCLLTATSQSDPSRKDAVRAVITVK